MTTKEQVHSLKRLGNRYYRKAERAKACREIAASRGFREKAVGYYSQAAALIWEHQNPEQVSA